MQIGTLQRLIGILHHGFAQNGYKLSSSMKMYTEEREIAVSLLGKNKSYYFSDPDFTIIIRQLTCLYSKLNTKKGDLNEF